MTVDVSIPQTSALEYAPVVLLVALLLLLLVFLIGVLVLVLVLVVVGVPSISIHISYKKCDSSVINQSYVNDTVSLASS